MKSVLHALAVLGVAGSPLAAQDPVEWSIERVGAVAPARMGSIVRVKVTARIQEGWHVYAMTQGDGGPVAAKFTLPRAQPFVLTDTVTASRSRVTFDQSFGMDVQYHEGQAVFTLPIRVARDAGAGRRPLTVDARYQACSEKLCLPPRTKQLRLALEVAAFP